MNWLPINCKTHFSLLKGFCKPSILAAKCKEYGYKACAITDFKTVSGAVDFHQACRNNEVKPLIGCDFEDYMLIAKNKDGWFDLIKLVTIYHVDPNIDTLKKIGAHGNLLCISLNDVYKNLFGNNFIKYDYNNHKVYYVERGDAVPHRVLLCSGMKTTLPKAQTKIRKDEDIENKEFFTCDDFFLPTPDTVVDNEEDIKLLNRISDLCEDYEVAEKPLLPTFKCPKEYDENEYLKELCRHGWKNKLITSGKVSKKEDEANYLARVKNEFEVIFKAELSGYFLIVQDIVNYIKNQGWLAGPGRGSAAGCLVSYLLGITEVDPLEYGLIFERFYNEGRNTEDYVSLPDIDVDVPAEHRDDVIDYIRRKYNPENVSQMITFGRLQGRAALKEVLRINEAVSFSEMNEITQHIPNEADISDQLELSDEKSIIKWTLINDGGDLKKWCKINEDGTLDGELSNLFEQAIKIEGTNKSQGKHAAGVIISQHKLKDVCPMVKDKNGNLIAAFEMNDLESQGHVKFDILGIDLLSKIMDIQLN